MTYFWYQRYPDAEYVLVDIADEMLDVARKRFQGIENISYRAENYIDKLPEGGLFVNYDQFCAEHYRMTE